jgi:hypothetical protein
MEGTPGLNTSWQDQISSSGRLINDCNDRWNDAGRPHHCAVEKQGDKNHKDVGCIHERTCDFAPAENLLIGPISVSVATPVISKVTAIHLSLFFRE